MVFAMSGWLGAATPVNDHFTNATELVLPVTYSFATNFVTSNEGATVEPGESSNPDLATAGIHGTIWYRWTCPVSGPFSFKAYGDTCAIAAGRFIGTSLSDLTTVDPPLWDEFGGNPDHPELGGTMIGAQGEAGVTYWFAIMSDRDHGPCAGPVNVEIIYSTWVRPTNDNQVSLPDAHEPTLLIQPLTTNEVGTYVLVVTNRAGAITSAPVTLTLESPTSPEILVQPQGDSVLLDQYFVLGVLAVGTPPLAYQWYRNGAELLDATNRHLVMTNVQTGDLGTYSVLVTNALGSVISLPASVTLAAATTNSGAHIVFDAYTRTNSQTPQITVRDLDGETLLEGASYAAQLYLGPSAEQLRPVTPPSRFFRYYRLGTWFRVTVFLPNFSTNTPYAAQIRAWDRSTGETYEEARAAGGKFGRSVPFTLTIPPMNWMAVPESCIPQLPSFSLEAGRPGFNVGLLELVERNEGGTLVWQLTGDPGFRYLVEKSTDSHQWQPFQVLTNVTGTVRFTDPTTFETSQSWYRSRILD
jgi:hypothetical protein